MTEQDLTTERKVHDLRVTVSDLLKLRCDRTTTHQLNEHEGSLLASLAALQLLCGELREDRKARIMEAAE
jgi:hypothetical protein